MNRAEYGEVLHQLHFRAFTNFDTKCTKYAARIYRLKGKKIKFVSTNFKLKITHLENITGISGILLSGILFRRRG